MYSTCLFCNTDLGKNQEIEHFPIGRRLAFDGSKGRLWVVCRRCERWNLTPLEERWEAIEQCERAFRATKLRVSTDHIGLARLKEGLELVRIGEPQRPEMAAWRYGDQFGRRRRKQYLTVAGVTAVAAGVVIYGPLLGVAGAGAVNPLINLLSAGNGIYRARTMIPVTSSEGEVWKMRLAELPKVKLDFDDGGLVLCVPVVPPRANTEWYRYDRRIPVDREIRGEAAVRAAGALLPRLNTAGGSKAEVSRAVGFLEEAGDTARLFRRAAEAIQKRDSDRIFSNRNTNLLKNLPTAGRLALEMAAHEDSERRALEGELHVLEAAWKEAEEIAGIADDMFLPEDVDRDFARLKGKRDATE
jgi:hypothetical protein